MNLLLLAMLLNGALRTPDTVLSREVVFSSDFEPGRGTAGLEAGPGGFALSGDSGGGCLRLEPTAKQSLNVWIPLPPTARGKWLTVRLTARLAAAGEATTLALAPVLYQRPPGAAAAELRRDARIATEPAALELATRLEPPADRLVLSLPAGGPAVVLDDLTVEAAATVRDEHLAELAERSGNLLPNGGFEAGSAGFLAVGTHLSLGRDDPPAPSGLRTSERDAKEGRLAAFGIVAGSTLVVTAETVMLKPDTQYTFSLHARGLAMGSARCAVSLLRPDGTELGRKEAALGFDWRRIKTSFTTPAPAALCWTPRIVVYPGDEPLPVQFDGLCLAEGDAAEYQPSVTPVVALDDGLTELGPGHLAAPGEPVTLKARYFVGAGETRTITLRAAIESRLGAERRELPAATLQVEPGVPVEAPLLSEPLPAGWYRAVVEALDGERVVARDELILASARPPTKDDGWRLAADWTTPDSLLPGPARAMVLGRLPLLGLTTRWLGANAAASWAAGEPRPGAVDVAALRQMLSAGEENQLGSVLELDPYPTLEAAPTWLVRESTIVEGRVVPSIDSWRRFVDGLIAGVGELRPDVVVAPPPAGQEPAERVAVLATAMAATAADWAPTRRPEMVWWPLPARSAGPLESTWVAARGDPAGGDTFGTEQARVLDLLAGMAAGHRAFRLGGQGFEPVGDGRDHHAGWTTADGGPRPVAAVWLTLREAIGARALAAADGGQLRLMLFGSPAEVAVVWSTEGTADMAWELSPQAVARLGTGEVLPRAADGRLTAEIGAVPLIVGELTAADAALLTDAARAL